MDKRDQLLVLVIGVPGSGKSTLAKRLCHFMQDIGDNCKMHEADNYFITPDGNYKFDATKLPLAHKECQSKVYADLLEGNNVIVANTSLRAWERKPYIDMVRSMEMSLYIVIMDKVYQNVHGVPAERVEEMKKKFEPITSDEFKGIRSVTFATPEEVDSFITREGY